MTTAQAVEYRIVQGLLRRSTSPTQSPTPSADRLIRLTATTALVFVLGTYLQELLWVALAGATMIALGMKN